MYSKTRSLRLVNKIKVLYLLKKRLTVWRFLSVLMAKVTKKIFNRHQIESYSQFGEDRVIENVFSGKSSGFYVDVGCNRPISYSNTWKLYLLGWEGIVIDANSKLIEEYNNTRPLDTAICKAISNESKVVDFYMPKSSHLISGIGQKLDGNWKRTIDNSEILKMKTERLAEILIKHNVPKDFELLSIDTEGNEEDVIDSLDLKNFTPQLIVVEQHGLDLNNLNENLLYQKLLSYQYRLIGFTNPTAYYSIDHG